MARPITYAIRVTRYDGRTVFVRDGRQLGKGPIATFRTREQADAQADYWRGVMPHVEVIERSHGRQFPAAREARTDGSHADTVSDGGNINKHNELPESRADQGAQE